LISRKSLKESGQHTAEVSSWKINSALSYLDDSEVRREVGNIGQSCKGMNEEELQKG
jgi:hypothetical protein